MNEKTSLMLLHIPRQVKEEDLLEIFYAAGPIDSITYGKSGNSVFINFEYEESLATAKYIMKDVKLYGKPIRMFDRTDIEEIHLQQENESSNPQVGYKRRWEYDDSNRPNKRYRDEHDHREYEGNRHYDRNQYSNYGGRNMHVQNPYYNGNYPPRTLPPMNFNFTSQPPPPAAFMPLPFAMINPPAGPTTSVNAELPDYSRMNCQNSYSPPPANDQSSVSQFDNHIDRRSSPRNDGNEYRDRRYDENSSRSSSWNDRSEGRDRFRNQYERERDGDRGHHWKKSNYSRKNDNYNNRNNNYRRRDDRSKHDHYDRQRRHRR